MPSSSSSGDSGEEAKEPRSRQGSSAGKRPIEEVSKPKELPKHNQKSFQKKYKFVSAQDDGGLSRKQARVHVMREVMRQKRWEYEEGIKEGGTPSKIVEWTKEDPGKGSSNYKPRDDTESSAQFNSPEPSEASTPDFGAFQSYAVSQSQSPSYSPLDLALDNQDVPSYVLRRDSSGSGRDKPGRQSSTSHPGTISNQEVSDPLDCLPPNMTSRDLELAEYYLRVVPETMFNIAGCGICNPMRDVQMRAAIRDPAVLHSLILSYAARHQAHLQGLSETAESASHKSKAIHIINQRLSINPTSPSDGTVLAALSLTSLEDRWGSYDAAWVHMRGIMQMIRNRGGPEDFRENWVLSLLINWTDYMISGYDVSGASLSFSADDSTMSPSSAPRTPSPTTDPSTAEPLGTKDLRAFTEDFISTILSFESLTQLHQTHAISLTSPRRTASFLPGTPLFRLLSSLTSPPPTPTNSSASTPSSVKLEADLSYRLRSTSLMAVLLYLNTALFDLRNHAAASEHYLKKLNLQIVEQEIDCSLSIELFLWLLIKHDVSPSPPHRHSSPHPQTETANPSRPWLVGKMLKVAKRLSGESWERLMNTLRAFLVFDNAFLYAGDSLVCNGEGSWEGAFRQEILGSLRLDGELGFVQRYQYR